MNSQKTSSHKLDWKRIGFALGILLLLLLVVLTIFVAFSGKREAPVGQAFFVDADNIPSGAVELAREETLIFRRLPAQAATIRFSTSITPRGQVRTFTLSLIKENADSYIFEINSTGSTGVPEGALVVRDRLDTVGDTTSIYLNERDNFPDLELSLQDGQLFVSSLHFVTPDLFKVMMFHNETGAHLGRVLRVNVSSNVDENRIFNGKLNTTSPFYPEVEFNILPTLAGLPTLAYNNSLIIDDWQRPRTDVNRTFNVTWGPAPSQEPVSLLLNVTGDVQGSRTSKYLVLAVGNRTLDINDTGYPKMRVDFTQRDHQGMNARLNVTFRATTQLQPFALPCKLSDADAVLYKNGQASGFLTRNANIAKVYSYDPVNGLALQSAADAPIGQIPKLNLFSGYFVELKTAAETPVIFENCRVENPRLLTAAGPTPNVGGNSQPPAAITHTIRRGWNLISIPGVAPTSLKEIAPANTRFELFSCRENEVCSRIDLNAPLQPGRAYWAHSTSEFVVSIE